MPEPITNDSEQSSFDCLKAIGSLGESRIYCAGQLIFKAGDVGDGFHVVEEGSVSIRDGEGGDTDRVLGTIVSGDFFGEMAVLDEAVRSASAVAEEPTRTRFLGRDEFRNLLRDRPEFALQLIRAFSTRLRMLNQRYVDDMVQSERLAAVGRFARAIVHDFKNPLAVISLATEVATQPGLSAEAGTRARQNILTQVAHMNELLHELIEFTRSGRSVIVETPIELGAFIQTQIEGLNAHLDGRAVRLQFASPETSVQAVVDAKRLARVIRNLVVNASDAMRKDGGTITVRVGVEGGEAIVTVADTGPGIAPQIASRLFEPFVTFGKEHGTGIGLSICKRIIEDHGGRIWAGENPGGGAAFSFALPVA
jgi:signal transduction histidine kinase